MAVRFAGSRHLHQRRRRLAINESGPSAEHTGAAAATESVAERVRPGGPEGSPLERRVLLLECLIAPSLWRHVLTIAVVGAVTATVHVLRWGLLPASWQQRLQAVIPADVLEPFAERLALGLDVALLALSAEAMLLIWWIRSLSPKDFRGRYRVWSWAALTTVFVAAAIGTHAAPALRAIVRFLTAVDDPRQVDWFWQLPAAVAVGGVATSVLRDLRADRRGRLLFQAACCLYMLAVMATHWYVFPDRVMRMLASVFATGGHVLLFGACLLHTHFVLYVTNDPPEASLRSPSAAADENATRSDSDATA